MKKQNERINLLIFLKINGEHKEIIDSLEKKIERLENKKSDEIIEK